MIDAEVVAVKDHGLYLRHGGLDGFINVTNLSWKSRPVDPRSHGAAGEKLRVLVYAVVEGRFYASLKDLHPEDNPWRDPSSFAVGTRHHGLARRASVSCCPPGRNRARRPPLACRIRRQDVWDHHK